MNRGELGLGHQRNQGDDQQNNLEDVDNRRFLNNPENVDNQEIPLHFRILPAQLL